MSSFEDWISELSPFSLGAILIVCALAAACFGHVVRAQSDRHQETAGADRTSDSQEGYVVSAVLGLLALMLGFTLAMAVDRFETRRALVLEEANAIGTTYLRAQLFGEPHRARLSKLLLEYTDNRIALARANRSDVPALLAVNDRILTDLWTATSAAFDTVAQLDFSSSFLDTMNHVIDLDLARKASRLAHVPTEVLILLSTYIVVTAGVLGYVLTGVRRQLAGAFLVVLLTSALVLIMDLERATSGSIREAQVPMELLRISLRSQPPEIFDRWRQVR
jgi:hypothetical protein